MADERHRRIGLYMDYELENWRELRKYKMCQPIADMLDEAERRGRADSVQKLVEALGCTPQQAMEHCEKSAPFFAEKTVNIGCTLKTHCHMRLRLLK